MGDTAVLFASLQPNYCCYYRSYKSSFDKFINLSLDGRTSEDKAPGQRHCYSVE